jgi:hypothetical protein
MRSDGKPATGARLMSIVIRRKDLE